MTDNISQYITIGRIGSPYGIKGWVKIISHTQPILNIAQYHPWYILNNNTWEIITVNDIQPHGKTLIAHLNNVQTPEEAQQYTNKEIAILRTQLPPLPQDEYYWHDLIGLTVIDQNDQELGKVVSLMETGANDVLIIENETDEILIPFILHQFVKKIDFAHKILVVEWESPA